MLRKTYKRSGRLITVTEDVFRSSCKSPGRVSLCRFFCTAWHQYASIGGIHQSPENSPHKALLFSLICAWMTGWANNRDAGYLRRNRAHYDVTVCKWKIQTICLITANDANSRIRHWNSYFTILTKFSSLCTRSKYRKDNFLCNQWWWFYENDEILN